MKKEDILKIAQETEKDERNELMTIKAHRLAGNVGILFACILALIIIIDGYILNSNRTFDFVTVAFILIGVGAINNAVFSIYQIWVLKKYSRIFDALVFGALTICATVKMLMCFWG